MASDAVSPASRRPARPVVIRTLLLVLAAAGALPTAAAAQRYVLRVAPVPGDTLRLWLDQETSVTSEERRDMPARAMTSSFRVFSHAVVVSRRADGTILVAQTDSVAMNSDDSHARNLAAQAQRLVGEQPVRLRLASDGTVRLIDEAGRVVEDGSAAISLIPAGLPQAQLAVGDTWVRSMPVPLGPPADAGLVRATFRLDSVSRGGRVAYISVRGDLARDAMPAAGPRGTMMRVLGTVQGTLSLDRIRGWIAESRFVVTMHNTVEPPAASGVQPVRFTTVVTQRVRLQPRPAASVRARRAP